MDWDGNQTQWFTVSIHSEVALASGFRPNAHDLGRCLPAQEGEPCD